MDRLVAAFLIALTGLMAGCFGDANTNPQLGYPTLLTVDPASFRGTLSCGAPGLTRYVVTLTDLSNEDGGFLTLPSSPPVPCDSIISFSRPSGAVGNQYIVAGHYYIGEIDGYDREDVTPAELGSRTMVDSTGAVVVPRWTTTCGEIPRQLIDAGDLDGGAADAPPPYNPLRFPTVVPGTFDALLRGCLPLAETSPPDASTADVSVDRHPDAPEEPDGGADGTVEAASEDAGDGGDAGGDGPEEDSGGGLL
jgi:hypothetical protein